MLSLHWKVCAGCVSYRIIRMGLIKESNFHMKRWFRVDARKMGRNKSLNLSNLMMSSLFSCMRRITYKPTLTLAHFPRLDWRIFSLTQLSYDIVLVNLIGTDLSLFAPPNSLMQLSISPIRLSWLTNELNNSDWMDEKPRAQPTWRNKRLCHNITPPVKLTWYYQLPKKKWVASSLPSFTSFRSLNS